MKMIQEYTKRCFLPLTVVPVILLLFIAPLQLHAQHSHQTARTLSLGGGGTAYQDLYHANFVNPANLMLNRDVRPKFTVSIAGGVHAQAGGSLANISVYNEYLTSGLTISPQLADAMLDTWFGTASSESRDLAFDVAAVPLGGAYRSDEWAVGFAVRVRTSGNTGVSRGFADLIFRGLDSDYFSEAADVNLSAEYYAWHEWSAGYARTLLRYDTLFGFAENVRIYAGIAPKLLISTDYTSASMVSSLQISGASAQAGGQIRHAFRYAVKTAGARADQIDAYRIDRDLGIDPKLEDYIDPQADDFTAAKGVSLGLDLGLTAEMDLPQNAFDLGIFKGRKSLRVGLAVTDIGSLSYSDRARTFSNDDQLLWEGFNYDRDIIDSEFDGDESAYFESVLTDSIGNDLYADFESEQVQAHKPGLPAMIRLGSHLMLGRFGFMIDTGLGLSDRGIASKHAHLSVGSEYRFFNVVPLRAGLRFGGHSGTTVHAGTGVEFRNIEFTLAASTAPRSRNYGSSLAAAWSGFVIHF
ncbi:DUF5723 family protein [Rhodohalobacter mucosus]|nr:DUF5723 family protein [Rhodohalobacter mucosus]